MRLSRYEIMNTEYIQSPDLNVEYERCVDQEREAWSAMHSCLPGSPQREQAWTAWSEAISRTNRAWRRLHASRVGREPGGMSHGHA